MDTTRHDPFSDREARSRVWRGARLRRVMARDPDGERPARMVAIPAALPDSAALALAELAPGAGAVSLAAAADGWIRPLATRAREAGIEVDLATELHRLLLTGRGAPRASVWRGQHDPCPGFVLNLAAFHHPATGFDCEGFAAAAHLAVIALTLADPQAPALAVGMADLAGLLAALGAGYDSDEGRAVAAGLAALLRAAADAGSAGMARHGGARQSDAPPEGEPTPDAPAETALPGLAEALRRWRGAVRPERRHLATTGLAAAGPAEALLGVETAGVAPEFSPLDERGGLSRGSQARLAALGMTAEQALAALLAGRNPLPAADARAHAAMQAAVAPFIHRMPAPPVALTPLPASKRRDLPSRRAGYTQKASIGGHRLYLRTGEYADGRLGEIAISVQRESPTMRGLLDAFSAAVSLGLQHGVPLAAFADAFVATRFGPAGAVEGDPAVARASSPLDYVFRSLAANYLGRCALPEPVDEPSAGVAPADAPPLLPLGWPGEDGPRIRRRALRLVAKQAP